MQQKNQKDDKKVDVRGEITAKFYDQTVLKPWEKQWNKVIEGLRQYAPNLMQLYRLGRIKGVDHHVNVICNAGFNAVTKLLTGDQTYTGEINKMALGSGVGAAAAASDTTLEVEEYRNDTASGTDDSNIAYLTAYFTEAETSGTFTEFGNFIDGAAGANTGQLWSHLKGLNWVKDNNTVIVVSCKYTFQSV